MFQFHLEFAIITLDTEARDIIKSVSVYLIKTLCDRYSTRVDKDRFSIAASN